MDKKNTDPPEHQSVNCGLKGYELVGNNAESRGRAQKVRNLVALLFSLAETITVVLKSSRLFFHTFIMSILYIINTVIMGSDD